MIQELCDLDIELKKCNNCFIKRNGVRPPIWTEHSKYVMLTERPYKNIPEFMREFWKLAGRFGLKEEQFLQISVVQCFPDMNKRTKKHNRPSQLHKDTCKVWFNDYLNIIKPKKMISFGNIPLEFLTGEFNGITELHGTVIKPKINQVVVPTVLSLPPSILQKKGNIPKMKETLTKFKEL